MDYLACWFSDCRLYTSECSHVHFFACIYYCCHDSIKVFVQILQGIRQIGGLLALFYLSCLSVSHPSMQSILRFLPCFFVSWMFITFVVVSFPLYYWILPINYVILCCRLYLTTFLIVKYLGLKFLMKWVLKHMILLIGNRHVFLIGHHCSNYLY